MIEVRALVCRPDLTLRLCSGRTFSRLSLPEVHWTQTGRLPQRPRSHFTAGVERVCSRVVWQGLASSEIRALPGADRTESIISTKCRHCEPDRISIRPDEGLRPEWGSPKGRRAETHILAAAFGVSAPNAHHIIRLIACLRLAKSDGLVSKGFRLIIRVRDCF